MEEGICGGPILAGDVDCGGGIGERDCGGPIGDGLPEFGLGADIVP